MDEITRTLIPEGGFGGGNAMYSSGVKYLSDNSDQTIVDIGALALAHKIRNM